MGERRTVPFAKPAMDEREASAARRVILSGWITQGPEVAAFEREFAEAVGAPHACAVSNCTTALHLALLAIGVKTGDEVITVSHSYIATGNCIRYCGAKPVFVEIEPDTFNIDPKRIAVAITPKTRAILCVHQMGLPCDLKSILEIAKAHALPVIEDAACAIGSEILWNGQWEKIGKPHADIACFSFHPRKVLTTGDGGMLTTANAKWDQEFRLRRQHGMSVPDSVRHGSREVIFETYPLLGYNYRMTDIQAAVGREQLKRLPDFVRQRRRLGARYRELLDGNSGLMTAHEPSWARTNWQSYCVRLPKNCEQKQVMQTLLDAGIATRRGVMCAHREPHYEEIYGKQSLPLSEEATDHSIILPMYPEMTDDDQTYVAENLLRAVRDQK